MVGSLADRVATLETGAASGCSGPDLESLRVVPLLVFIPKSSDGVDSDQKK